MNWESAFRVVAHEIRSPTGVIAGYARLLASGRLDQAGREDAIRQIERAAGRLGTFADQASELSTRLAAPAARPAALEERTVPIAHLINGAATVAAARERLTIARDAAADAAQVRTRDARALSAALASVIDAAARLLPTRDDAIGIGARRLSNHAQCEILIGPPPLIADPAMPDRLDRAAIPVDLEAGGLGLQVILGAAVFEAQGARLRASAEHPSLHGIRLAVVEHP